MNSPIAEHLTMEELELLERSLSVVAPDLLSDILAGKTLTPGPRLRLDDVLTDYLQRVMTEDYQGTPESEAVERLLGSLARIQEIDRTKLKIGKWKKGDPIPRGMSRYEEL